MSLLQAGLAVDALLMIVLMILIRHEERYWINHEKHQHLTHGDHHVGFESEEG